MLDGPTDISGVRPEFGARKSDVVVSTRCSRIPLNGGEQVLSVISFFHSFRRYHNVSIAFFLRIRRHQTRDRLSLYGFCRRVQTKKICRSSDLPFRKTGRRLLGTVYLSSHARLFLLLLKSVFRNRKFGHPSVDVGNDFIPKLTVSCRPNGLS